MDETFNYTNMELEEAREIVIGYIEYYTLFLDDQVIGEVAPDIRPLLLLGIKEAANILLQREINEDLYLRGRR